MAADCTSAPNPNYSFAVGYRGNESFSIYHGLNNRLLLRNFRNSGVDLSLNYTWSHAIDNLSSTFFEAGLASQYGNSNITINNGDFVYGLLDPFHPNLDRGNAEFDIRQRVTRATTWGIPFKRTNALSRTVLGGLCLNPLFVARTGQPFSIFDTRASANINMELNTERAAFNGPVPNNGNGLVAAGPDTYQYLTFTDAQIDHNSYMTLAPGAKWPSNMSGRDAFRAPGWWSMDFGIYKGTKITERFSLQLRGEAFNVFNHANLYVVSPRGPSWAPLSVGRGALVMPRCMLKVHGSRQA